MHPRLGAGIGSRSVPIGQVLTNHHQQNVVLASLTIPYRQPSSPKMPGDADSPPSEATPLLSSPPPPASSPDRVRSIASAFTIMLLLGIAAQIAIAPQTQLLNDIICSDYYSQRQHKGTFPSRDCYAPAVQSEMAFIIGWEAAIENIPSPSPLPLVYKLCFLLILSRYAACCALWRIGPALRPQANSFTCPIWVVYERYVDASRLYVYRFYLTLPPF